MMAVETFVYLYIIGFGLSAFIAIVLLLAAARRIGNKGGSLPGDE